MNNFELENLKESYNKIERRLLHSEMERKKLIDHQENFRAKQSKLLSRLEDAQQEAEGAKEWANTLHNELLTLRGQVTAYKHCIAAMTGTDVPPEITGENPR